LKGDDLLRELMRISMSDVADAFDANGNLLPIREMPLELRRAVSGMEVIIKNAAAGDGHTDRIHKIRFWDKVRALETLAKHLGLLSEHIKVDGDVELSWKL
jgi:phage terminase small subunit